MKLLAVVTPPYIYQKTYAKNEVVLEPSWISDAFELREPELYKLVTTVTCDDESPNIYFVPVGRFNIQA